ncbi:MAG TPA: DNA-directed RNA polymerase subunit beta, partial [Rhodospirillaceae bacterium]|nr:DNA-directed RNA polymerase subunit beta [Rhodospirillaceae bacterium]
QKLRHDLVDAKSGEVIIEAEGKITPRLIKKLSEQGVKEVLARQEDLIGRYVAEDLINETNGLVIVEAGDELTEENLQQLVDIGITELPTLHIDLVTVGPWIRNTLAADKNISREDALVDIYRVMRPGEPPTLETAEALFRSLFFDSERYDLSAVGRVKMNSRLGFDLADVPDHQRTLRREDILHIMKVLVELKDGRGEIDDIDHL